MKYKIFLVFILFTLVFSNSLKAENVNYLHFISYGKSEGLAAKNITDIYQDTEGYLWLATNNGIWKYNGSRFYQTISKKDGLSSNTVLSLFVDSRGVFWAGTPNGLNKITNGKVEKILGKGKYFEVSGIEDENKNLWYVFDKHLVKIKNDRIVKEYGEKDGIKSDAFKITKDRFNNIWLGTISSGIYKLVNGKIEKRYTTKDGLAIDSINEIGIDGKTLWITDENGSLNQMRIADGKIIHKKPSITGYLHSSFTDKAGNIWFGSSVGLLCYKKGKKQTIYTTKNNLQSNYVNVTFEDRQGNIWVGTSGGVSKWIRNKIIESFPTSKIYAQATDSKGRIWLGHPDGLRIFDGQKILRRYSVISESMTPQENFDFVNAYLKRVGPPIRNHDGFIVKYLGDSVMAVFPNRADDAVMAAIEKLEQVTTYNIKRQKNGYQPIRIGIGVHIGHMMVGMVGEAVRMQGDALSDNVNLTSCIEGLTKFYGVNLLISGETLEFMSQGVSDNWDGVVTMTSK